MNHICYFYIFEHKSLQNMGISLDARYTYEMKDKVLTVRKNEKYVEGIWPEGVISLAALVGNNGAGKTTVLDAMVYMLTDGSGVYKPKAIVVYENMGHLYAYQPNNSEYRIEGVESVHNGDVHGVPKARQFYYSSYFRPYRSLTAPLEGELTGVYNATDTWKLVHDVLSYARMETSIMQRTLSKHLAIMIAEDNNRMAQMLVDSELRDLLPSHILPRYILINPNYSGYYLLQDKNEDLEDDKKMDMQLPSQKTTEQGVLNQFISTHFYNCAAEITDEPEEILALHTEWRESIREGENAYDTLDRFVKNHLEYDYLFIPVLNMVHFLAHDCEYDSTCFNYYIDTYAENSQSLVNEMMRYFNICTNFTVAHLFDISFSHTYGGVVSQLSSGETDLLKFFSRLYDASWIQSNKFGNIKPPQMVLIDEAENSYHPEWQRQFVSRVLKFLHALYLRNKGTDNETEFQVVLTTHSPILLSDIPKMCINYLEKDSKTGKVSLSSNQPETFGANVFDLYRHAFFLHNGMVGEFASEWLTRLQKSIKAGKKAEALLPEIDMIGDERIKDYMIALLEKREQQKRRAKFNRQLKKAKK